MNLKELQIHIEYSFILFTFYLQWINWTDNEYLDFEQLSGYLYLLELVLFYLLLPYISIVRFIIASLLCIALGYPYSSLGSCFIPLDSLFDSEKIPSKIASPQYPHCMLYTDFRLNLAALLSSSDVSASPTSPSPSEAVHSQGLWSLRSVLVDWVVFRQHPEVGRHSGGYYDYNFLNWYFLLLFQIYFIVNCYYLLFSQYFFTMHVEHVFLQYVEKISFRR